MLAIARGIIPRSAYLSAPPVMLKRSQNYGLARWPNARFMSLPVGLATSCLAIGKDGAVVTIEDT